MNEVTKYINKRMIISINKLSIQITGGQNFSGKNNMFSNSKLDFVDRISENQIFGEKEFQNIFQQASAYMYYILKNHPFIDGNKRTALATTITFLEWNKHTFSPLDEDGVFEIIKNITISEESPKKEMADISKWLKSICLY